MVNSIISRRKSIRDFDKSELSDEIITSLFEAARRAPSAFNEQPWRFILGHRKNKDEFDSILDILAEKNRAWAVNASLLVIVLAKKNLTRNNSFNKHFMYDTASAVANLTFQANSLDLYVHQMGGFDSEKVKNNFSLSDEFEPAVVLAIGRKLDEELVKNADPLFVNRMPLTEILYEKKFGHPHSLVSDEFILNN